jgi:alkylation response protein AidB-like acyl-CoA dehydrogenase
MFIWIDQSRSILRVAFDALGSGDPTQRARCVSAAKHTIGRAAKFVGANAIQLHGGVGLTREYKIRRYYQSLLTFETLFGNEQFHLEWFATSTGRRQDGHSAPAAAMSDRVTISIRLRGHLAGWAPRN